MFDPKQFFQNAWSMAPSASAYRYKLKEYNKYHSREAAKDKIIRDGAQITFPLRYPNHAKEYYDLHKAKSKNIGVLSPGETILFGPSSKFKASAPSPSNTGSGKAVGSDMNWYDKIIKGVGSVLSSGSNNTGPSVWQNFNGNGSQLYGPDSAAPNSGYSSYQDMADRNNALSLAINESNNQFNAQQAELQRNWQAQMANTAHQREVADLKAAGLNPVLSAGGTGAVTPSGGMASNANYSNVAGDSVIGALATLAASAMSANATTTAASINAAANMYASDKSYAAADLTSSRQQENVELQSGRTFWGGIYKNLQPIISKWSDKLFDSALLATTKK